MRKTKFLYNERVPALQGGTRTPQTPESLAVIYKGFASASLLAKLRLIQGRRAKIIRTIKRLGIDYRKVGSFQCSKEGTDWRASRNSPGIMSLFCSKIEYLQEAWSSNRTVLPYRSLLTLIKSI